MASSTKLDLNADLGESWYDTGRGDDAGLMPYLDSCNIACGFHGGDTLTIQRTIDLALKHGVKIGAHPSFADRQHFGRRALNVPLPRLISQISYQIAAVKGMVEAAGGILHHVKAHGALYHYLATESPDGAVDHFLDLVYRTGVGRVYGPPGGHLESCALRHNVLLVREGFADRQYELRDGSPTLRSRQATGAVLEGTEQVVRQVASLCAGKIPLADGEIFNREFDTVCLHGDHSGAVERARAVRRYLDQLPA